jgi:hypothetical protein
VTPGTFAIEIVLPAVLALGIWGLAAAALVAARRRAFGPANRRAAPRSAPRLRVLAGGASSPPRQPEEPTGSRPPRGADAVPLRVVHRG